MSNPKIKFHKTIKDFADQVFDLWENFIAGEYTPPPIPNKKQLEYLFEVAYSTSMDPSKKAEVFFELHSTNNPGGTNPNWYYYWSEALGVTGDHTYNGALPTSRTIVTSATTWTIEIGQNAHWSTMGNPPTGQMYIDGFWATNLHENWHKDHRVHNFSAHGSWGGLPPAVDPDGDDICTPWENTIGTNPNVPNSTEDGANWAEQNGVYNHQDKDWACPGSQW